MTKTLLVVLMLVVMVYFFPSPAALANSQDFHLSVFIPPIPGVNVPENADQILENEQNGIVQLTEWEEISLQEEKILLKTVVAR